MDKTEYEDAISELQGLLSRLQPRKRRSPYSIYETENSVIAALRLPGIPKDNVELFISEDMIEVHTKRNLGDEVHVRKSSEGLPAMVIPAKAKASYVEGMLRVEVPKLHPRKRRITIN